MSELKYVVTDKGDFAIFTKLSNHCDVRGLHGKVVGAGFCNFARKADSEQANVHCYGRSVSLGISSREEDEDIINLAIDSEY